MADPILYYDVTLNNGGSKTQITVPWVLSFPPLNASDIRIIVLESAVGHLPQGMYLGRQKAWQLAIPYVDLIEACLANTTIDINIGISGPIDFSHKFSNVLVYTNGELISGTSVDAQIASIYGILTTPNTADIVHTVDGQLPDATGNVIVEALPAETPSAYSLSIVNDPGSTTGKILLKNIVSASRDIVVTDNGTNITLTAQDIVSAVEPTPNETGSVSLIADDGSITHIAQVKQLIAGANIFLGTDANAITVNAIPQNVPGSLLGVNSTGTGISLVNNSGVLSPYIALIKSVTAGTGVTIVQDGLNETLTISAPLAGVSSVNGLTGGVTLAAGTGISLQQVGQTITINSAGAPGTVTEVAMSMPPQFLVSGSPVTTTGTLTANWASQNANVALMGPAFGGAAQPTFRSIQPQDLPLATSSTVGVVQPGFGILVSGGVISVNSNSIVGSFNGRTGAVTLQLSDITGAGGAPLNSPAFTGTPTAPTQPTSDNSTNIATTAFVKAAIGAAGVTSFNTRTGAVTLQGSDITGAGGALLASNQSWTGSNDFTSGSVLVSTKALGDNSTSAASTQYVYNALSATVNIPVSGTNITLTASQYSARILVFTGTLTANITVTLPTTGEWSVYCPATTAGFSITLSNGTGATLPVATGNIAEIISNATAGILSVVDNATGVQSFNTRTGAVTLTSGDITGAGGALLASPAFTGTPTAPTPTTADSSTKVATTAYVQNNLTAYAPLASPTFTGVPAAPTASSGTSTTQIATTAFVANAISGIVGVSSFNTRTGSVVLQSGDISGAGGALLNSPAFTGIPTAPTAAVNTNTTQVATTAFVVAQISASGVTSFNTRTGAVTLQSSDISGAGGALLASPAFTGVPTAPTAPTNTNTTQVATTAFVQTAVAGASAPIATTTTVGTVSVPVSGGLTVTGAGALSANVLTVAGRTGNITLAVSDVSGAAPLASPAFTGTPTAPTPTAGDSSTNIATTAFVMGATTQSETSVSMASGNTSLGSAANYQVILLTGALPSNSTLTVPYPGRWTFYNQTTGNFTLTISNGGAGATYVLQQNQSITVMSDQTIGVVPASTSAQTSAIGDSSNEIATTQFVQTAVRSVTSINVTGSSTLTQAQYNTEVLQLNGTLTGNVTLTFPTAGQWMIYNNTTGAFNVTLSNGSGATYNAPQNQSAIVMSLGSLGIVNANTSAYVLAPATTSTLGGVIVPNGSGLTVNAQGDISVLAGSASTLGGVKQGAGVTIAGDGTLSANVQTVAGVSPTSGNVPLSVGNITGAAPLASPSFTGTPTAPTPTTGDNSTNIATTAFVNAMELPAPITVTANYALTSTQYGSFYIPVITTGVGTIHLIFPTSGEWIVANAPWSNNNIVLANGGFNPNTVSVAPGGSVHVYADSTGIKPVPASVGGNGGVSSFNTRTGAITLLAADVSGVGGALVGSANTYTAANSFTSGSITVPTVTTSDNSTNAASTAYVQNNLASYALLASPTFTGTPAAPTAAAGTNTTQIATTAFVYSSTQGVATVSLPASGAYTLTAAQYSAPIVVFTGTLTGGVTVTVPNTGRWSVINATTGSFSLTLTNSTASSPTLVIPQTTTSYTSAVSDTSYGVISISSNAGVSSFNTRTGAVTLTSGDITGAGGALLASPAFTGTPTAPTATSGTNTTQLATTAFVQTAVSGAVTSFNTRTGAVTLQASDVTGVGGALLASPAFTGTPTAPTQTLGDNSTKIATTAYAYSATQGQATVALSGSNVTLTAAQYSAPFIKFTGTLTANITVTLPTTGNWNFYNATTGAFTVTLSNGTGATLTIPQSNTLGTLSDSTAGILSGSSAGGGVSSFNTRTGAVTLQASDVTGVGGVLNSAPTISGRIQSDAITFKVNQLGSVSGTQTLDLGAYSEWTLTATGNITFAFTNTLAAGYGEIALIRLTNGGSVTVSWPASTKFANGTPPSYTASGTDLYGVLYDVVTSTYMVFVIGQAIA